MMKKESVSRCAVSLVLASVVGLTQTGPTLAAGVPGRSRIITFRQTPRLAVLPVVNQSTVGGEALGEQATALITQALAERTDVLVVPAAEIQKAARGRDLQGAAAGQQVTLGRLVNADWVVRFVITQAGVYNGQKNRSYEALELNGWATSTDDGTVAGRVYARGARWQSEEGKKPETVLHQAVADAVDQLIDLTYLEGVVIGKPYEGAVRTSLGTITSNFRPRGEVAFYNGDELIGYGDTAEVDDAQSLIRLRSPSLFGRISLNTRVRPTYNPPLYAAGRTVKQDEKRIERKEDVIFTVAATTALVIGYLTTRPPTPSPIVPLAPGVPPIPFAPPPP